MKPLALALPSKGRLMEAAQLLLARAGLRIERSGASRGYRGTLSGSNGVDIVFLSAAEIVLGLKNGAADLGVTGEDLLRDAVPEDDPSLDIVLRLGFGPADVAVAVPECWLDVAAMSDLVEISARFHAKHGRRLRVATKYPGLTRRYFAEKGILGYRIVESAGATEGAPATGAAELIVDITTTGSTLKANHLKVLDDGVILRSEAVLAARRGVSADERVESLVAQLASHVRPR
ncbi:MAG TPA: ATP phosphoribosyltransferase [Sphingomicrobium sp.]|nr:ATP phosphoribosyltransferase [Sphingomicrobium sp.]